MQTLPRKRDESHGVVPVVPLNTLGVEFSSGSDTFVLGPGYEAVGNGQVPQAIPGQAHDVSESPSIFQSALTAPPFSASATPHSAMVASSPSSSPTASPSISEDSSAVSASSLSVMPSISASVQRSVDISSTTFLSDRAFSSLTSSIVPTSTSYGVTDTTSLPSSVTSSTLPSVSAIEPAVAISSDNGHGTSFWAGIALLSIAGTATLITLFAWWLRMRSRMHRRPWESGRRWGRAESCKFPEDAISSSGGSPFLWQQLVDREVGEVRHSTSNFMSSYRTASHGLHLPATAALSPFMCGPYPTVRPLPRELRHSDTSVPGVMQDIGSLRVANLVAGDILTSGDESSRPATALDDVGTPRESSVMPKPRYLGLNGSGLNVPWVLTPSITTGVTRSTGRSLLSTPTSLSLIRSAPPRESLVPPRLPHLPALPRVPHTNTNAARSRSTKGQHGSRSSRQLARFSSSSASSATSVGSDMSRSSGGASMARWARLSEKEEAARHALRQRRLRSISSARSRPLHLDEYVTRPY